jgi:teichuronic acid biosynthesis glycosyltransferase TuaG
VTEASTVPPAAPLVSVVIPAYNCEPYVEEAIRSVLNQPLDGIEVIVVDDASTDATARVLERLASADARLRVLSSPRNSGQGACRNRGVRAARGRYLAFQDADDLWLPDKLARQLDFLRHHGLAFCFCGYGTIDENGEVIIADLKIPRQTDYLSLLRSNTICPSSVIYDRQLMDDIVMPERPRRREDLISWLNVARKLGKLEGIPEPLCMVRRMRGSSSSNKLKTLHWQWRVYRDIAKFGILRALLYLGIFAFTSLAKRSTLSVELKRHVK